jgi:hypothetical protein
LFLHRQLRREQPYGVAISVLPWVRWRSTWIEARVRVRVRG